MNELLKSIIRTRRGYKSSGELQIIHRHLDSVPGMQSDGFGNRYLMVGTSTTIISCHTDTVHNIDGHQSIVYDKTTDILSLNKDKLYKAKPFWQAAWTEEYKSGGKKEHKAEWVVPYVRNCLGADDGAGMYTALRMIQAKVPALYVFHRGEEKGGLGSAWLNQHDWRKYMGFNRCIAIDRRGRNDIITKQRGGRCCSNTFAEELALRLDMKHKPCPYGSFTDSANYTDIVPECTNISAGYQDEHGDGETLYVPYLETLIESLCSIDLETLPVVREVWEDGIIKGDPPEPVQQHDWDSFMGYGHHVKWIGPATPSQVIAGSGTTGGPASFSGYSIQDNRRFAWEKDDDVRMARAKKDVPLLVGETIDMETGEVKATGKETCLHLECHGWTGCLYDSFGWE